MLTTQLLIRSYSQGWFPMSEDRDDTDVHWYQPEIRGIIPLDEFHVSKNIQRIIRQSNYEVTMNTCFREVMEACADRNETWISDIILDAYTQLHLDGYAQSVEIWKDGDLVGGLYGVSIRRAFFGESMFHTHPEMDKIALWHCHQYLVANHYLLWDTQFYTDHLGRFGCKEIPHAEYIQKLEEALRDH